MTKLCYTDSLKILNALTLELRNNKIEKTKCFVEFAIVDNDELCYNVYNQHYSLDTTLKSIIFLRSLGN